LAALLASFLPAWSAVRVSPLEAMSPLARPSSLLNSILCALAGLILLCIDPLLMFGNWPRWIAPLGFSDPEQAARAFVFYGHFVLGLPTLMVGYFLFLSLFVRAFDGLLAYTVAESLALHSTMVRQSL